MPILLAKDQFWNNSLNEMDNKSGRTYSLHTLVILSHHRLGGGSSLDNMNQQINAFPMF